MRLFLIRHAESTNNRSWADHGDDTGRSPDAPLTELGHVQAAALAAWLHADRSRIPATTLYTSLAIRCVETAGPLADALDLPLQGHDQLIEIPGLFDLSEDGTERVPHPGAASHDLLALSARLTLPHSAGPHGWWPGPVEDDPATLARAAAVVEGLAAHGDDEVVAMVTHGAFTQYLIPALMGSSVATNGWFTINNTGVSEFELVDGHASLHFLNRLDHLSHHQITT
jgi:2,3-bisphosphoglycerate-dependent phosphoglycerate mutase